jgi:peptide/nickel transport system ATP-binding protein
MADELAQAPLVQVTDLRKVYPGRGRQGEIVAVDGVSFELAHGRALALVGESGSGKTTIARILVGLERPTAGRVLVCGRERRSTGRISSAERRRRGRELQIVFQDPYQSLNPRRRIRNLIGEVLDLHFGLSGEQRRARVSELLEAVGLHERHAASLPRQLSGGERQRVAIARALAAEPRVVILDEAVSALDVSIQAQIVNLLADLRTRTGVAYLFVSHNLAVVRQVCDETVVMRGGRIVEQGSTERVLEHPEHPYTRLLADSVPRPGWKPTRSTGRKELS